MEKIEYEKKVTEKPSTIQKLSKNNKKSPKKQHVEELDAGEYEGNHDMLREEREVEERDTGHIKSLKNFNKN